MRGGGALTALFAERGKFHSVIGIEYDDEEACKASQKGIRVIRADLSQRWPIKSGSIDVCISSQNIEHMHRTRFYVREMYRVLRPKGYTIVLTENLAGWVNVFALLFGWQPFSMTNIEGASLGCPLTWHIDLPKDPTHLRRVCSYSLGEGIVGLGGHVRVLAFAGLSDILIDAGFRVEVLRGAGYAPFAGKVSRVLSSLDPRHAHFLVAKARKPNKATGS
ncbi:hypothetical protein HKBW3C_01982 [Candidatus Hakubella thermalkaliphila]|nr:hypothetical protein HKBW3C_01982 [Candidatus Hakubella thermalkaliphila]